VEALAGADPVVRIETPSIVTWKRSLLGVLKGIALTALVLLVWRLGQHGLRLARWECLPAVYQQWTGDRSVEVEAIRQGEPVRFQVTVAPSVLYQAVDTLRIGLDPADPGRAVAMDFANLWRRLVNPLAFLVVAIVAHLNLARAPWGEDRTWSEGVWVPTPTGSDPSTAESNAVVLRETGALKRYQLVVLVVFAALSAGSAYGVLRGESLFATVGFILSTGVTCILAGILMSSRTLRLLVGEAGLVECTCFGARRVPWAEIHAIRRRNLNAKAQRDYARSDITPFQKGASRPATVFVDFIVDNEGREILSLADGMEPMDAFRALRQRIEGRSHHGG
jgi:hypothetical protein